MRTTAGVIEADAVVLAGGPWTAALARRLGAYVPVRPVRGQMLSLEGPPAPLRHVIWGARAYLVPREDGQTYVGATVEEVGYRKRTTVEALRRLRRGAAAMVPALARAHSGAWAGLRPATPDGLPIMGRLPGWSNVWVSTGHFRNGILLAPISGQLMAESILAGRPEAPSAPLTPLASNSRPGVVLMPEPKRVHFTGGPGGGKTTAARQLAQARGAPCTTSMACSWRWRAGCLCSRPSRRSRHGYRQSRFSRPG